MIQITNILFAIRNTRDGFHHNSLYWQNIRKGLPVLTPFIREVAIAMVLSDAGLAWTGKNAYMKIEQGYKQSDFVTHLFNLFEEYCFAISPQAYIAKTGPRKGLVKSYWFKTFSHASFTAIWDLFYTDGVKTIKPGLVLEHITGIGLAYWVMSDGSLQNDLKTMILHTQSFTKSENEILSSELNIKFGLHSRVISHKSIYWVIIIPSQDSVILYDLISAHIIPSFQYKIPVLNKRI